MTLNSKFLSQTATTIALSTSIAIGLFADTQIAFAFTVTSTPNSNELLDTILGDTTGLSNFELSVSAFPEAIGVFQNDPFGLGSGIVLSTGKVSDLPGQNTIDSGTIVDENGDIIALRDLSTNFSGTCDTTPNNFLCETMTIDISFDVNNIAEKIFFNYVFGSEEFVEFGGDFFNDSFQLLLNGENLAKLSDGQTVEINNLVPNGNDPTSFHPDYINNPAGIDTVTRLDGYTQILGFEGLLVQNARNTLTIEISDIADNFFDSAVFLQVGTLGTTPTKPEPTSVPEPGLVLGCLLFGGLASLGFQKGESSTD